MKKLPNKQPSSAAKSPKRTSLLAELEFIVEKLEDSNFSEEFYSATEESMRYVARKMKLKPAQIALLSMFVDRSHDDSINLNELANYVDCRTLRLHRMRADFKELEQRRIIRASRRSGGRLTYRVPSQVMTAISNNQNYVYEPLPVVDVPSFFHRFASLYDEMRNGEVDHESLLEQTLDLLEPIQQSEFAARLTKLVPEKEDQLLFIFMSHLFLNDNDNMVCYHDLENIFDDEDLPGWVIREFRSQTSTLFQAGLIENANEDGIARTDAFCLTDFAKTDVLVELDIKGAELANAEKFLTDPSSFAPKTLFYNPAEDKQISKLSSLLSEERFARVQERLARAGMRRGFCCLFYGAPGTGKTETVYQLARATGRPVFRVDVDQIKSKWVGDSEKNIKRLFDRYRSLCQRSPLVPILLFNEADGILGLRSEQATRAVDKMENSIQNIILQEMESLEGIMIATTNLTSNLDPAFERRFLYKVRYEKPSVEAREKIWLSMLPGLDNAHAKELARAFDFSGGEIENITRKHTVNCILADTDTLNLDALRELCTNERIAAKRAARPVGF